MVESVSELEATKHERAGSTFINNMVLPIHGWYCFSAGFSATWVENLIKTRKSLVADLAFLDPFAGVGTAVLAAENAGARAYGLEAQPFLARVAECKMLWHTDTHKFFEMAHG